MDTAAVDQGDMSALVISPQDFRYDQYYDHKPMPKRPVLGARGTIPAASLTVHATWHAFSVPLYPYCRHNMRRRRLYTTMHLADHRRH